jgi:hypothetical protein
MVLIKKFTYRADANEEWSNKYYLDGTDPADAAAWLTLYNALTAEEKKLYESSVKIVRAYGYTSDSPSAGAAWVRDATLLGAEITGTGSFTGNLMAGDQAAMLYWKTGRLTSKGKAIYLRKFFHGGRVHLTERDQIAANWKTELESFATLLASGAGVDGRHIRGIGQSTDTIFTSGASPYVTTRTLKRRGRRPTPAP